MTGWPWLLPGGQTRRDQPRVRCFSRFAANPPEDSAKKLIQLSRQFRDFAQMEDQDSPTESLTEQGLDSQSVHTPGISSRPLRCP